jgi:hypothetical protein
LRGVTGLAASGRMDIQQKSSQQPRKRRPPRDDVTLARRLPPREALWQALGVCRHCGAQ